MRTYRTRQECQQEKDAESLATVVRVAFWAVVAWVLWFVLTHYVEIAAWLFGLGGG